MSIDGFGRITRTLRGLARSQLWIALLALVPAGLAAQQPATLNGKVTNGSGAPLSGAQVTIDPLGAGAVTRGDGSYTILVPAARVPAGPVAVTARLIGYKANTAEVSFAGGLAQQDFTLADNPLQLGEVVVTGAGTSSEVEKLGTVRNFVDSTAIVNSYESNIVNALAAKAPNVSITSSAGDPGASSYIQIRGITSVESSDGQPLFVVDGVPVDNVTQYNIATQQPLNGGTIFPPNPLISLNPDDIENIEILKGASSGAIYGSRAGQGVILITTKKGRPGQTKYSLRSTLSLNEHTQLPALQTEFGQGSGGVAETCVPSTDPALIGCGPQVSTASYGPKLAAGTPVYDHANEVFQQGYTTDNTLNISGGSDRTQFFLSGGYNYDRGIITGTNSHYRRISVRFNGEQRITDQLKVGANVNYSNGYGGFVQSRNDTGGIMIGALRTPPEFNNQPFVDPIFNQQRSYRFPNPGPGTDFANRGYDNPLWVANEEPATSNVSRTFGGISGEWAPASWLKFNETLGLDYTNDERFEGWAVSNSETNVVGVTHVGGVTAGYIRNQQLDNNLTATLSYSASQSFKGTFTVGQNLNSQSLQSRQPLGTQLIAPQPFNLGNVSGIQQPLLDFLQKTHLSSYFGQATADIGQQLYLTAAIRNDGVSSFDATNQRAWFPKASAAWVFYRQQGQGGFITYGKLRTAYGQSGTQPTPYLLSSIFAPSAVTDGGWGPASSTAINGVGGLISGFNAPATILKPERVKEFEAGVDLGLVGDKADLSVTYYRQNSSDVILNVPVPTSTGYVQQPQNAAQLQNRGWEVSLNLRPVTTTGFAWDVGLQWARNRGTVPVGGLPAGLQFAAFPFSGGGNGAGLHTGGSIVVGQPIGVYLGTDYVRCGRGLIVGGIDIDHTATAGGGCGTSFTSGALFIDNTGYPQLDNASSSYVLGDPNPDWTGSVRTNFRFGKITVGGLLDIRHGGIAYNGTKGALNQFGTGLNTAQGRDGGPVIFGTNYQVNTIANDAVAGPGAGTAVPLNQSWFQGGASVFNGPDVAFLEDGGWVKIRELSIGYTLNQPWISRSLGFSSIEMRLAGRNLVSWNNYDGVDPETSLLGAGSPVRGLNYFNSPQARSWVFSLTFNR